MAVGKKLFLSLEVSVVPAGGEEGGHSARQMSEVFDDVACPLPGSGGVQFLDGGQGGSSASNCALQSVPVLLCGCSEPHSDGDSMTEA